MNHKGHGEYRGGKNQIEVIYEDLDLIVVEKASGVITYPVREKARGSVIQLIRRQWMKRKSPSQHLYLLHRLDQDTSGLLVFAKTSLARKQLIEQFQRHLVLREYVAVTDGIPSQDRGSIRTFLGRDTKGKRSVMKKGRLAVTDFEVLLRNESRNRALILCRLKTGRTHQLRIHLAHLGTPVVGDAVYGRKSSSRLALHACTLGFLHPRTGRPILFYSSLPVELKRQMKY